MPGHEARCPRCPPPAGRHGMSIHECFQLDALEEFGKRIFAFPVTVIEKGQMQRLLKSFQGGGNSECCFETRSCLRSVSPKTCLPQRVSAGVCVCSQVWRQPYFHFLVSSLVTMKHLSCADVCVGINVILTVTACVKKVLPVIPEGAELTRSLFDFNPT